MATYLVQTAFDDEANVWYVEESNVPGLAAEADTFEELCRKVIDRVPDLLELNGVPSDMDDARSVPLDIIARHSSRVLLAAE